MAEKKVEDINIDGWSKMVEKKWYVCMYDMWDRGETDPEEFESIKEAEESAREYLVDYVKSNAEDIAWGAELKCRKATVEEIAWGEYQKRKVKELMRKQFEE